MTIKQVSVSKLFGCFSHVIKFSQGRVSLIIGENGVGKTVCLTMIEAIFNKRFDVFSEIDFDVMKIQFDDDVWRITKDRIKGKRLDSRVPVLIIEAENNEQYRISLGRSPRAFPRFRQISEDRWMDRVNGFLYTGEDLIEKFGVAPDDIDNNHPPKWYVKKCEENQVKLIGAQRLYRIKSNDSFEVTIKRDSEELAGLIQREISKALDISADLDSSFPNRLLSEMKQHRKHDFIELMEGLSNLETKRKQLNEVGLLDTNDQGIEWDIKSEDMTRVLWLYIEDSKKKLDAYSAIQRKLSLMISIINKRFKHKRLFIDKEKGYVFKSATGSIPVEKLSSGEQNEMVLIYHLLFNCNDRDIIMIDEPEISLHITWQQNLIADLNEIIKLNNLTLLLATHSPDLIGDNWELVQTLA